MKRFTGWDWLLIVGGFLCPVSMVFLNYSLEPLWGIALLGIASVGGVVMAFGRLLGNPRWFSVGSSLFGLWFPVWFLKDGGLAVRVIVILLYAGALGFVGWNARQIKRLREQGLYPKEGQGTDADVQRLADSGETILAIRLYREIHNGSLADAKAAVEAMSH